MQVDVPPLVAAELGVGEADVCKEGTSTPCTAYLDAYNAARTGGGVHDRLKQGKNIGWTMVSLHAADQLRQRVAWSLYQLFVVSDKPLNALGKEAVRRSDSPDPSTGSGRSASSAQSATHARVRPASASASAQSAAHASALVAGSYRSCGTPTTTSSCGTPSAATATSCARWRTRR